MATGDGFVHKPHLLGLLRGQALAGEDQAHPVHRAHQRREAIGPAEAGHEAQLHFGKAELRIIARDPVIAGERHLQPAAQAMAVHHGDGRTVQILEAFEQILAVFDHGADFARAHGVEHLHVGAGHEAAVLLRVEDQPVRRVGFQLLQKGLEAAQDLVVQHVCGAVRHVHAGPAHPVGIDFGGENISH